MARTLLIGLDGATFTVLDPLVRDGHMPFLGQLLARGAHAELSSTPHAITPAAWTSMITGRTPGHHGIFDFIHGRLTPAGFYFTLNMSYDVRCPTLWSILSRRGMRVAALNFPVSYPPEPVNGVCVPGFVHWKHLRQSVYPPAFYDTMRSLPGFDAKLLSMDMDRELQSIQHLPPDEYEPWLDFHIRREGQWFRLARLALTEGATDLTAVIFDGVDKLQHLCWRLLDPASCPRRPTAWEAKVRDQCLAYFRQLDDFVGELVALAGPEARVFLASDHGFGPTETVFFANTWLARQGYLSWASEPEGEAPARIAAQRIKNHVEGIDWRHTVAYALTPSSNGICIRLADGAGSPGILADEYQSFRARLADELLALNDPHTGTPFFRHVLTREQAFPGEAAARAPDLTLVMQDYGFLSVLNSPDVFRRRPEPWGTHYPQGVFLAAGAGIVPRGRMPRLEIVDVAPILLRSLGLAPEPEMEGRCPDGLFDSAVVPDSPPESVDGAAESGDEGALPSPRCGELTGPEIEVQAEVLDRLKALGYLQS